jgi:hypothetical protein
MGHEGPHLCYHMKWTDKPGPGEEVGTFTAERGPWDRRI